MRCLDRRFRPMAERLLRIARRYGPYHVTSSCRTHSEQARLFRHPVPGYPVAAPGTSMHERGLAVDIARRDIDPHQDVFLHVLGASWRETDPSLHWSETDPIHFEWRPN